MLHFLEEKNVIMKFIKHAFLKLDAGFYKARDSLAKKFNSLTKNERVKKINWSGLALSAGTGALMVAFLFYPLTVAATLFASSLTCGLIVEHHEKEKKKAQTGKPAVSVSSAASPASASPLTEIASPSAAFQKSAQENTKDTSAGPDKNPPPPVQTPPAP